MNRIALIVMERSNDWAAALRLRLSESSIQLIETRLLDECWRLLVENPTALAVLELTADNVGSLLALLLRLQRELPEVRAIVVASRQLAASGNLVREAGAIHFEISPRSLGNVAELVRRRRIQLDVSAACRIDDLADPRPNILASLPWSEVFGSN